MSNKKTFENLMEAAADISIRSAAEAKSIGYIPRFFSNISLPTRRVDGNEHIRTNGRYRLHLLAPSEIGLPYGCYPRLLLIHIATLSKLSGQQEIFLGRSMSSLLQSMGLRGTGGKTGSLNQFKDQSKRLFTCTILWTESDSTCWNLEGLRIVDEVSMTWEPTKANNWETHLTLSHAFWKDIQENAVPIDNRVVSACSYYPLAIDIYCWLTYRFFHLRKFQLITWDQLENQFGNQYAHQCHFKLSFRKALKRVSMFYTAASFSSNDLGLTLYPSPPHVKPSSCRRIQFKAADKAVDI